MTKISVIITGYNCEKYLEECLISVLKQPYQNLEIIFSNDGSTDSTKAIAESFAEKDERLKIINHENFGIGKSRNLAIDVAQGDWLLFLDSDDKFIDHFLDTDFVNFLNKKHDEGIKMLSTCIALSDESFEKYKIELNKLSGVYEGNTASRNIKFQFGTCIYHADLFKNGLRFSITRPEMETIFRHKAAYMAEKVFFIDNFVYYLYRVNNSSVSRTWNYCKTEFVRTKNYIELYRWHEEKNHLNINDWTFTCLLSSFKNVIGNLSFNIGLFKFYKYIRQKNHFRIYIKNKRAMTKKLYCSIVIIFMFPLLTYLPICIKNKKKHIKEKASDHNYIQTYENINEFNALFKKDILK